MFLNLTDLPYIDISDPWWSENYIRQAGIGEDGRYFLGGDLALDQIRLQSCAYFNKDAYRSLFGEPEDLYTIILDGKWTIDCLHKYCADSYADLNGDSTSDPKDRFGMGTITANLTDHFTYCAGVRCTERNENDIPYLVMNNERTVGFTEKLYRLFYENPGVAVFPPNFESLNNVIPGKFKNGELIFMFGWFYSTDFLRDMESDFGVIPYPKYDEQQESYLSLIHDSAVNLSLPSTCDKPEELAAVLELMAYESWDKVTPAYYEGALKTKYVRDSSDEKLKIIDMIHDNAITDFGYVYNYALDNIGLIERDLMGSKKSDFASMYQKKEKRVQKKLDELIEVYTGLGN